MSLAFKLILATACRSNHHRIALLALARLTGPDGERWRDLLLHHHGALLEGAKAPDDLFKDFKNHVLHPGDGFWGGAIQAAEAWRARTLHALKARDWRQAAYAAGVMSHYLADPCQPLHTAQSETENTLHRAVEQSFSKAFPELRVLMEARPAPALAMPKGADWLGDLLRAAATRANAHYDTVIDHYDHARGVKDPPAGLDATLKEIAADQIAYAAALVAIVLDRTFAEAAIQPPVTDLRLDTVLATLGAPLKAVLGAVEAAAERRLVEAQYAEVLKTGKVRRTLPADDRAVRALYAREVLKVPVATLDCEWPRVTGAKHTAATPKPSRAKPAPKSAAAAKPRLSPEHPVVDAPAIGPKTAERLKAIGVERVEDLLALAPEDAAERIAVARIGADTVRDWQDQARLACSVPGLSGTAAQLLVAVAVRDLEALAAADPDTLTEALERFAATSAGERILRDGAAPKRETVAKWIAHAHQAHAARRVA